jgi:Mn-containing catalase
MHPSASKDVPHTRPWQSKGEHAKLYTFSPADYQNLGGIWSGTADWADGAPLQVIQGMPEGADPPEGNAEPGGVLT